MGKTCRKCNVLKDSTEFYRNRLRCKSCIKIQNNVLRSKNRERRNFRERALYAKNPTKKLHQNKGWASKNKPKLVQYALARQKRYPEQHCAEVALRRARKYRATPKWANPFFIGEIYHLAALRTKMLGFPWHVDHIVPLRSPLVCGLHVENNLQVIPAADNYAKRNNSWPGMP